MDSWEMICELSRQDVPVDSQLFEASWCKIKESSYLKVGKPLYWVDWQYLMMILAQADVSRIQYLVLELPHLEETTGSMDIVETVYGDFSREMIRLQGQLGIVLGTGRFSSLKTLRILGSMPDVHSAPGLICSSLAAAFKSGQFTNLRRLYLPACDVSAISAIFEALTEGGISHLSSFSIMKRRTVLDKGFERTLAQKLDAVLKSGCFKSLQHLDLSYGVLDGLHGWKVFAEAIRSRLLPSLNSLRLSKSALNDVYLAELVPLLCINSFETLILDGCRITSEQVCAMVDAIMKFTETGLALKHLVLHDNRWEDKAVDALVSMADLDRLPQLQKLDLRMNTSIGSRALVSLIDTIRNGHLPSLQRLNLVRNLVTDLVAEAIAQAYFENEALTAKIDIDWSSVSDLSLRTKVSEYRDRNVRLLALKDKHSEDLTDVVPLNCAKVFLCGYPEVGKTKLRKTLIRHLGFRTRFRWETHPHLFKEPRTRGIELSRIDEKEDIGNQIELILWDLAGQEEYHVLHGTFLADLGFAGGKATTFVLVFRAPYRSEVKEELLSWLRFVASSSLKHVRRRVVIVLNCFEGKQCTEIDKRKWVVLIRSFATLFNDLLDISLDPFIMDVRIAASVKPLKDHLFDQARTLLQDVEVPRVCFELLEELKGWSKGKNSNQLPVLTWEAFRKGLQLKYKDNHFTEKDLKIGASYLHEVGEIIYFEREEPNKHLSRSTSVVVPDPQWFCKEVVGQLLLPKEMLDGKSCLEVCADGSISLEMFQNFFEDLLFEGTSSDDVISMLERVGLCYRKGKDEIILPALIREDDYNSMDWEGQGFHAVMGRCFAVEDKEKFAIPMTLFRRLQVELAQDLNFGGRGDSEYRVGKSFSNFKVGEHLVLVQFDMNQADPIDDRIDVLVKSMANGSGDPVKVRLAQVKCICEIMQKLEVLCVSCCPGLMYGIKVIKPWSATQETPKMIERKLMALREIEGHLVKGHPYSSWVLNGALVEFESFFSDSELKDILDRKSGALEDPDDREMIEEIQTPRPKVIEEIQTPRGLDFSFKVDTVAGDSNISLEVGEASEHPDISLGVTSEREYGECKQVVLALGLLTEDSLKILEDTENENSSCPLNIFRVRALAEHQNSDPQSLAEMIFSTIQEQSHLVIDTVRGEGRRTRRHVDKTVREDGHRTREFVDKRIRELMLEVQAQQAFSIEEEERSVPRYMFLTRKQGKSRVWISLKEAFRSSFQLHLLCEAHFDDGFLHEVRDQEGIELTKPKEWLVKVSPWLRRSLQVAVMVGKTVGNIYLPGVFTVIPDLDYLQSDGEELAKAVDRAATMLDEDEGPHQGQGDHQKYGTATHPVDLKERMIAERVVEELRNDMGRDLFAKRIRLKRVLLRGNVRPDVGSSKQASVLWICQDCFKKYKECPEKYKIDDISP